MHVNLVIATVLFAVMYVFAASDFMNKDLAMALAWTAAILTVIGFLRAKPLDKLTFK
jgi:hypothetical protein